MKYLFLLMPLFLVGCPKEVPVFNRDIYVGDSTQKALVRKQGNQVISASDPKFDKMVAMSASDMACFISVYITQCKEWKSQDPCGLQPSEP